MALVSLALFAVVGAATLAADIGFVNRLGGSSRAVAAHGGYVYANVGDKLAVLDASGASDPVKVGETPCLPAVPQRVALWGNYAYVPVGLAGLSIVDVQDPANPTVVTTFDTPGNATDVVLQDVSSHTYAYVADESGLRIVDVTDPANPVMRGAFTPGARIYDVALAPTGTHAYCTGPDASTYVVNVSDPDAPSQAAWLYTAYNPTDLAVDASRNLLYLLTKNNGFDLYGISDGATLVFRGNCGVTGGMAVALSGNFAYVAIDEGVSNFCGLKVADVSDPLNPHVEGEYKTRGGSVDIALMGQCAFLADQSAGVRVIDVGTPSAPVESGFYYSPPAFAQDVTYSGHYAFVAGGGGGLRVFDVAAPAAPVEVGSFQTEGYLYAVAVAGSYAFLAEDGTGLRILDVSDPAAPVQTGLLKTGGYVRDVKVLGGYAYLADYTKGLRVVDVSDKSNPLSVGLYGTNAWQVTRLALFSVAGGVFAYINGHDNPFDSTRGMAVVNVGAPNSPAFVRAISVWPASFADFAVYGGKLYAAQGKYSGMGTDNLRVYDLTPPDSPVQVGLFPLTSTPAAVWADGPQLLLADGSGLSAFDVSDPSNPAPAGGYATPEGALGVAASPSHAFLADGGHGLYVLSLNSPQPLVLNDFNGDGKADILWRSGATGDLYAWYMDGAAKIGGGSMGTVGDQGWRVAGSGDFSGDGKTDLLWRNYSTGENYVWYMDGPAQTGGEPVEPVADASWKVAGVADFNSDGKPDILWRNASTGEDYVWYMNGAAHAGGGPVDAVPDTGWKIAGAGDFNGDGKPDILWRNAATGGNYAWYMDGAARAGGAPLDAVADAAWFVAWVGDYDGDGDADILWRNTSTGENVLWTMDGVARAGVTYLDAVTDQAWRMWDAPAPVLGVPSDFDLDGKADVLWRGAATGDLYVWTMDGVVRKGAGASIGSVADAGWKVAGTADFNSDGSTDLLWRNYGTGENFVWYMNGLVQSGCAAVEAVGDLNWWVTGTGDFNADGKPDILWRNYSTGDNYVWYMDGVTKTGFAPLDAVGDAAWKIAGAADFSGDGKTDILWRNAATGQVYIWAMDGVARLGGADLGIVPLEWKICWTADYNGDGNPDILWRNTATGDNHVWYIVGAAQVGGAPVEAVGDLTWDIMPQIYPAAGGWKAGDLYDVDVVVGNLRYVPSTVEAGARLPRGLAGGFLQGSPADEPCRLSRETQFTHTLTLNLAVMESR